MKPARMAVHLKKRQGACSNRSTRSRTSKSWASMTLQPADPEPGRRAAIFSVASRPWANAWG